MRKLFSQELVKQMKINKNIYLLLGGVGYGLFKPDGKRIINCEASEQAMVDIAVGLALGGKIPFVYAITPHLYRAFEGIRIYLDHYKIPVKLVGCGRDRDYGTLGFTHYGEGDAKIFECFKDIETYWPTEENVIEALHYAIDTPKPIYINLTRV